MRYKFYLKLLTFSLLLVVSAMSLILGGCGSLKTDQKEEALNPIVYDEAFKKSIAKHRIRLIAPASGTEPELITKLQNIQCLNMDVPSNLITADIPFHANTDEKRLELLKEALYDDSNEVIVWTYRGGYGTARLINELKKLEKPKTEKIFIGFSDITALHLFLSQNWKWKTIHAPGLGELLNPNRDPENIRKTLEILDKNQKFAKLHSLKLLNPAQYKGKKITGGMTGGNLTMVQTSLGTPWQIKTRGKILFLEDVNEKGYHVDRALNHLKQAGVLKNVKAIIFGDFANPGDDKVDFALQRFAAEMPVPVFKTDEFGHGIKNYPIIYNSKSEIVELLDSDSPDNFSLNMKIL